MSDKKESILSAATELFSEHGYHAVGVDTIVAKSCVAKMTFYKHFPSKIALIESVLVRRDQDLRRGINTAISKGKSPILKVKAIFDWYLGWFNSKQFHGCMFIKASEEFPDRESQIKKVSQEHKLWLAETIKKQLLSLEIKNPNSIALHLIVILDGLTVGCNLYKKSCDKQVRNAWMYSRQLIISQMTIET